jgi:hypothetical protein
LKYFVHLSFPDFKLCLCFQIEVIIGALRYRDEILKYKKEPMLKKVAVVQLNLYLSQAHAMLSAWFEE